MGYNVYDSVIQTLIERGPEIGIANLIYKLGGALDLNKLLIFKNNDLSTEAAIWKSWINPTFPMLIEYPTNIAYLHFNRWATYFSNKEYIYQQVDLMPPLEANSLPDLYSTHILLVPIFLNGDWWGFIWFGLKNEIDEATIAKINNTISVMGSVLRREKTETDKENLFWDKVIKEIGYAK